MDIFLIETVDAKNVSLELLQEFQKKEISNQQKLRQHCFSYLMVDRILGEFYKFENREIVFKDNKPYLKSGEIFFSISHSHDYIALAFSNSECGIDIEKNKQRDFVSITNRMGFYCNTLEEFYEEWTKYEAEYKLAQVAKGFKTFKFEDYTITAVSENIQEIFEIYIQSGEMFSNPKA